MANSTTILKLKDVSVHSNDNGVFKVKSGKSHFTMKADGKNRFLLNGIPVVWSEKDTQAQLVGKMKKAYKMSKKKNALLERLFIDEAGAVIPIWFAMAFAAMVAAGLATHFCNKNAVRRQPVYVEPVRR